MLFLGDRCVLVLRKPLRAARLLCGIPLLSSASLSIWSVMGYTRPKTSNLRTYPPAFQLALFTRSHVYPRTREDLEQCNRTALLPRIKMENSSNSTNWYTQESQRAQLLGLNTRKATRDPQSVVVDKGRINHKKSADRSKHPRFASRRSR